MKILAYFCPFSHKFHAIREFKRLDNGWKQAKVLLVTALFAFITLPVLGLGGVAAFRAMVEKYAFRPIDPSKGGDTRAEKTAGKIDAFANDKAEQDADTRSVTRKEGVEDLRKLERGAPTERPSSASQRIINEKIGERKPKKRDLPRPDRIPATVPEKPAEMSCVRKVDEDILSQMGIEIEVCSEARREPAPLQPERDSSSTIFLRASDSFYDELERDVPIFDDRREPLFAGRFDRHAVAERQERETRLRRREESSSVLRNGVSSGDLGERPSPEIRKRRADLIRGSLDALRQPEVDASRKQELQPSLGEEEFGYKLPHDMAPDELREYVKKLGNEIKKKDPHSPFLVQANQAYLLSAKLLQLKAFALHQEFIQKFPDGKEHPEINPETGIVSASLFQLKTAIKLAKAQFPAMASITFNEEQRVAMALLVQIILCGEKVVQSVKPESACAFEIKELQGKKAPSQVDSCGEPYIDALWKTIQFNSKGKDLNKHLEDNMLHAAELFAKDCLLRDTGSFKCGAKELLLGQRSGTNHPEAFFKDLKESYVRFLSQNPAEVKKIVKEKKNSFLVKKLNEIFLSEQEYNLLAGCSLLHENVLKRVLAKALDTYSGNAGVKASLLNLIVEARMDEKAAKKIAESATCKLKDVESLARIQLIEMMLLMNQGNFPACWAAVKEKMDPYANPDGLPLLSVGMTKSTYALSADDFSTLQNATEWKVMLGSPDFATEGLHEFFQEELTVARVTSQEEMLHYSVAKGSHGICPVAGVKFNWQVSEGILDHLVSQIDPQVLEGQPTKKFPALEKEFTAAAEKLEEIAKVKPQQTLLSWAWNAMANWGNGPQPDSKQESLQSLSESIGQIADSLDAYLTAVVQLDKDPKEVMPALHGFKDSLTNAAAALLVQKRIYQQENDAPSASIVADLVQALDQMALLLPDEKAETTLEKGYLDRLRGVVWQSNDPKEIEWKVKKYESQILELKARFEEHFKEELKKPSLEGSMTSSWILVEEKPASAARKFYDQFLSVKIDLNDKKRFTQQHLAEVRSVYNDLFFPQLRKEMTANGHDEQVLKTCNLLFTGISLENECLETLQMFDEMGAQFLGEKPGVTDPASHGTHPFVKRINNLYKRLNSVPYSAKAPLLNQWANSARGQWNCNFDPYIQGNPVHVLYQLMVGEKAVKALGMGTPTIEDSYANASLSPEFIGFGRFCKKDNKKHLFVLNQNTIPKNDWKAWLINGDETNRCKLILDSQDRDDMKGAMYAIALSKNSKFYAQSGVYEAQGDAAKFKDALYEEVLVKPREQSGCYIPEGIREEIPDFDNKARAIIKAIHQTVFDGKAALSQEERKVFIELFYDHITLLIINELDIDSFNISCKDAIDRGAGSNAQLVANRVIVSKGDISPAYQKKVESLMMTRALMVRKRPPLSERVERFVEGLEFSLGHVEKLQQLHQEIFGTLQIVPV